MQTALSDATHNRLLAALPPDELGHLLDDCVPVTLKFAEVLAERGEPIAQVYFPTDCAIVMMTLMDENASVEVGLVGNEGVVGTALILDVTVSSQRALVQGPGGAMRIEADLFRQALERSRELRHLLNRYVHAVMAQLAQTAGCTRFHVVEARLARWLLMTQDRARSDSFHVTHEFLAQVLGVRRVGITRAATTLQGRGLIRYARGNIAIVDRAGLEAAACGCYAADKLSYAQSLTIPRQKHKA